MLWRVSPWLRCCSGQGDQIVGHVVAGVLHPEVTRGLRVFAARDILVPRLATEVAVANLLVLATMLATDRHLSVRVQQVDLLAVIRATGRLPTIEVHADDFRADLRGPQKLFGGRTSSSDLLIALGFSSSDLLVDLVAFGLRRRDLFRVVCEPIPDRDHVATLRGRGDAADERGLGGDAGAVIDDRLEEIRLRPEDTRADLLIVHVVPF